MQLHGVRSCFASSGRSTRRPKRSSTPGRAPTSCGAGGPPGPDWETPIAEADARVGGSLRIVMRSPNGEEFGGGGEFVEVTPGKRLVLTWAWDGHQGHGGSQLVEVEFKDLGDGTTSVLVTNRGLPDEESEESHREGWEG